MAGVDENQTRYDRHQPCRLHPVIGLYGVMFRNEIFQTVFFVLQPVLRHFLILVGAHDEPADLLFSSTVEKLIPILPGLFYR